MKARRFRPWVYAAILVIVGSLVGTSRDEPMSRSEPRVGTTTVEELASQDELVAVEGKLIVERSPIASPPRHAPKKVAVVTTPPAGPEPDRVAPAVPSGNVAVAVVPPPVAIAPRVNAFDAPPDREKYGTSFGTARDVALVVGALGLGMGSAAAASGDGTREDTAFALVSLGVGVVGFGTAFVLWAAEPEAEKKNVRVMMGPGAVSLRGTF